MLTKEEFLQMLADENANSTGWQDHEVDEFMQVIEDDGWVIIQ